MLTNKRKTVETMGDINDHSVDVQHACKHTICIFTFF
jgi:hypothetical protein